jgi:hypothetical protein
MSLAAYADHDSVPSARRPHLLSVEDAKALDVGRVKELFTAHLNPGRCISSSCSASTRC